MLLLATASIAVFFTEKVDEKVSSCVECSHSVNRGSDWQSSEDSAETEGGVLDGKTGVITRKEQFFVEALR